MTVPSRRTLAIAAVVLVVIAAIVGGLRVIGSPRDERMRQLDRRRVDDLASLTSAVDLYWSQQKRLPASLDELRQQSAAVSRLRDPVTEQPYEYRPTTAGKYEVCATFQREVPDQPEREAGDPWWHAAGRKCFQREPHINNHQYR